MASDAVVNLIVNADDAENQVNVQLRRIASDAERRAPDIALNVTIDNASVVRALGQLSDRLGNSLDDVNDNLARISDQLRDIGDSNSLRRVGDDADRADRSTRNLSGSVTALGSGLAGAVATASRLTIVGGVASQAVPLVGALVTTVESLVPAAAAGVSAFLTVRAAALTLQLGLVGVEDAINAVFDPDADPEELAEALDRLSDNARDFVLELQDMAPAFGRLRLDVQDRLFRGLDTTLRQVANATFPELRRGARDFSDSLNAMARGAGSSATQLGRNGTLGRALRQSTDAFDDLERIPGQVLTAIVQLATAGGPLLNRLTRRLENLADSASRALNDAFETGRLEDSVNDAGDTLAQLGRIGSNVFGALGNLMDAAGESGTSLFGTLENVTQALEDVTGTTEFQETLGALIDVGQEVARQVLPLLLSAFEALAPAIQILAPYVEDLVRLIGENLNELIPELAPLLSELATLFGQILVAISPLIEEGIQLLIDIMPDLLPLFESLSGLITELNPLIEYFAVGAGVLLKGAFEILIPVLTAFVDGLALVVNAIDETLKWLARFVHFAEGEVSEGIRSLNALLDGDFQQAWNDASSSVSTNSLTIAERVDTMSTRSTVSSLRMASNLRKNISEGFSGAVSSATRGALDIAGTLQSLSSRVVRIMFDLAGSLYRAGKNMISSLADGILSQLGAATAAASRVVQGIRDFFPSSPAKRGPFSGRGYPYYSGREVIDSFARGITDRVSAARSITDRVLARLDPFGPATQDPLSGIVGGGPGFAGIANTTFARLTPNVNVYVGNEALSQYVRVVVEEDNDQRDRLAAQGAR